MTTPHTEDRAALRALAARVRRVLTNPTPHPFQQEWSADHSLTVSDILTLCDAVERTNAQP